VWQAAGRLGIPVHAAAPAVEAGLAEFGARRRLRHPLVRSASYWSASAADRQAVHGVLVTSLIRRLTRIAGPGTGPGRGRTRRGPHLATR
jgi:hypothetical protein